MTRLYLGYAREDFTPEAPVSMNTTKTATEILTPIYASCLAWQEGETTILQYSMDIRNIYEPFYRIVSSEIAKGTGIPEERLLLSVTHNHSCPDVALLDREEIHRWVYEVCVPALIRAGKTALDDLAPVEGAVAGKTVTEKLGFVRRYRRADGSYWGIAVKKTDSPLVAAESKADPELRTVRIKREGKKSVLLINFQTHAASGLGTHPEFVHSDFVGSLREEVEKSGEDLAFYLQGACGNVNCNAVLPEDKIDWPDDCFKIGRRMAEYVKASLKDAKEIRLSSLRLRNDTLTCQVNHAKSPLAPEAEKVMAIEDQEERIRARDALGITSKYELAAIVRRAKFPAEREMPLSSLVIGDLAMGFAPVELFDTCGKMFRDASAYPVTFFVGYTNGSHSYMPSAMAFPHEGYEVLQCHYVAGTGEMIALKLGEMIHHS